MDEALKEALKAKGCTFPNPLVGAVLVKDNRIIAKGFHKRAGLPHAEVVALDRAGKKSRGATLYINLEPCFHWGKTPPCVDRVIASGVEKVVVSTLDPNPLVKGKSLRKLRKAGVKVEVGLLRKKAMRINEVFFKNMQEGLPFVVLKIAQTLDGKIADERGISKWITQKKSRDFAKKLRSFSDAVLVGINTVLKDNPFLDVPGKKIVKVILDPHLNLPARANLFKKAEKIFLVVDKDLRSFRRKKITANVKLLEEEYSQDKGFNLRRVLKRLYSYGICSLFVEGGSFTAGRFLEEKLVDKVHIFIASKIMGGRGGVGSFRGIKKSSLYKAISLKDVEFKRIGGDFLITGYPFYKVK